MAEIGYKIPYKGEATDIGEIAAPGYKTTLAPCVYFSQAGFRTNNETGIYDNAFLAVNDDDQWKTGIGAINYYKSSVKKFELTNDIASIYSCPNFKKVIGFYGDGTRPDPTAKKVFKWNTTYRLQVRIWNDGRNDGFLISIGDDANNGSNPTNVGQWHLKNETGALPTALIVGIQAAGGNGGGDYTAAGGGGGAGGCAYLVLDWEKARQKVLNERMDYVKFDFYITPIEGWKTIAYGNDGTSNTCSNNCVAINLKDANSSSSSHEAIKSKCIVGCGQDAYLEIAGAAGIVKNYDLDDNIKYTNEELSEYGIHILTMHKSGNVENAGNGGAAAKDDYDAEDGYKSNKYWLTTTNNNKKIDRDYFNTSDNVYQFEHLYERTGGHATTFAGGGGASNYANGGNGGTYSDKPEAGEAGTLGSGGGGGGFTDGGIGGLPYIFFCSNIDFSITDL